MSARSELHSARKQAVALVTKAKSRHLNTILKLANVVGAGVGYKVTQTGRTDEMSIMVAVSRKLPKGELRPADLVPRHIDGVRTDVIETGRLRALSAPRDRMRPAQPGSSIAHFECTAGTFGCLVKRDGEQFILSNNHVLATLNQAKVGDPILQPGPTDGGTMADQIATLADFVPIDFGDEEPDCQWATWLEQALNTLAQMTNSAHRLQAIKLTPGMNKVDAALARPLSPDLVRPEILDIGLPAGVGEATLGTRVKKSGRTTGFTTGAIQTIDMTVQIDYDGPVATFHGQLLATPMSQRGDSGSVVLDQQNRVVGLLFAGSDRATMINPIDQVLKALRVTVVAE